MADEPPRDEPESLEAILEVLYIYYRGDRSKVQEWLRTPNPSLGLVEPIALLREGRPDKLVPVLKSMISSIEEPG